MMRFVHQAIRGYYDRFKFFMDLGEDVFLRILPLLGLVLLIITSNCNPVLDELPEEKPPQVEMTSVVTPTFLEPANTDEPEEVQAEVREEIQKDVRVTPFLLGGYISNPGIGWQSGSEPDVIKGFPETVTYINRRDIAWSMLNPARQVYAWQALDSQLEMAKKAGKQVSFRIYTYVGEGYDGSKIPAWVFNAGARLLPTGVPDYTNCVYQEKWAEFINELIRVYDGNPNIAFIDISGYGNFNEWNWQDHQTEWDDQWDEDYSYGTSSGQSFRTLDGQARRRLVDIFIGGSFEGHACRMPNGEVTYVDYAYPGFQKNQLIMPYAGIAQSTQYVLSRRNDVGFRYDCLGRDGKPLYEKIGAEIEQTWMNAPVVFELCGPAHMDVEDAHWLLQKAHGSIVHNNQWRYSQEELEKLILPVGYRYFLKDFHFQIVGRHVQIDMEWQNLGLAPNYPKMGQSFELYFSILDETGKVVSKNLVQADISGWLPATDQNEFPPGYPVTYEGELFSSLHHGRYQLGVSIIDQRTGLPIQLAINAKVVDGIYILFQTTLN